MSETKTTSNASAPSPLPAMLLLATPLLLTACNSKSTAEVLSLSIYQPRVLSLPAGVPVQTAEGIYTPQMAELWHSDAAFRETERRLRDADFQIIELRKEEASASRR